MRRFSFLLHIKTVHKSNIMLGLFFIVWQLSFITSIQLVASSNAHANIITTHGLDNGDQSQAEQLFHQGMQAYLNSNYQQAYKTWSQAAGEKHPKAVFNIGMMWLQGQVPDQTEDKKLALEFFQQAASLGYTPAKAYLKKDPKNLSVKQQTNTTKSENTVELGESASDSGTTEVYTNNKWLKQYSDSAWVIQIFASQDSSLLKQMIRDYSLKDKAQILTEKIEGALWYKLIYGQYKTKQNALNARQSLPERLRKEKPWVRSVSAIKNTKP